MPTPVISFSERRPNLSPENNSRPAKVLVTSGPTRAWIDRVRYIANASTGSLGARIVETLIGRGIPVRHLSGIGAKQPEVSPTPLLERVTIATIDDLIEQIRISAASGDIRYVVHAMAVLDYVPERSLGEKRSSDSESWDLRLVRTPKVTALIRELLPDAAIIGFKLEAGVTGEELRARALESLRKYRLSLVVANDLDRVGPENHEALFIDPRGEIVACERTKRGIAERIADFIQGEGI